MIFGFPSARINSKGRETKQQKNPSFSETVKWKNKRCKTKKTRRSLEYEQSLGKDLIEINRKLSRRGFK